MPLKIVKVVAATRIVSDIRAEGVVEAAAVAFGRLKHYGVAFTEDLPLFVLVDGRFYEVEQAAALKWVERRKQMKSASAKAKEDFDRWSKSVYDTPVADGPRQYQYRDLRS